MTVSAFSLGQFKISGLRDGFFYLDGGAMFGVVPKTLWEKKCPSDESNRIKLGLNSILIECPEANILIETGIGAYLKRQYYDYYSIERNPGLEGELKHLGLSVEDIDYVINTHLHFDHCGGNTKKNQAGDFSPVYPNAKYIIQKGEWETALDPGHRDKASYMPQLFFPLEASENLCLVQGNEKIIDGVEVVLTPGHTRFHQCVKIVSEGNAIFFLGDMVPTSAHAGLPYIMSYDLYPMETLENKEKFFDQGIAEDWIFAFNHDAEYYFGKIAKEKNKYSFFPLKK